MTNIEAGEQSAIISVAEKAQIEVFAEDLLGLPNEEWRIVASGGTAGYLSAAGIAVTPTAEITGMDAVLDHKVVTIHPKIAGGLLADQSPGQTQELADLEWPRFHMVVNDLYPLEKAIAEHGDDPDKVRAMTDIGGRLLLTAGAKGERIVVSRPDQRADVLEWLRTGRPDAEKFLLSLESDAEYEVARYSFLRAQYLDRLIGRNSIAGFMGRRIGTTKYGENAHQTDAGLYFDIRVNPDPLGIARFEHIKGWELSYVNETDIYRLRTTASKLAAGFERNFGEVPPMAIGVKHGNSCGASVAETHLEAVEKMLDGDLRAIHGGVVMINGEIDEDIARALMRYKVEADDDNRLLDGVVGASVTDEALEVLSRAKLRVVVNPELNELAESAIDTRRQLRVLGDAALEQDGNTFVLDFEADYMEYLGELTEQQKRDLLLAWAVGCTSNSNTITLAKNGMLIGNGVGQQDRVGAGQLALSRTTTEVPTLTIMSDEIAMITYLERNKLEGAVAYSDSFFPFPDGPTLLANAGIKAMLTSWNTERHKEILREVHAKDVTIAILPDKVGRGFFGH